MDCSAPFFLCVCILKEIVERQKYGVMVGKEAKEEKEGDTIQ